ncbi:MAG: 50S ribosomal protein L10 [Armatimonadota bacterium]|nr:50S ribosomal protein L10 [Armatimonadota bacterium]MDR7534614.1 50S ribosomal protein L10 [Armatimonadota bacterium]MDR7537615.1 50S ribosomal protein L10 [Armatimonadota bacterium]
MPRAEKVEEVERLQDRLQRASAVILTDFRGLTVGEITQLRQKLRDAGVDYRVVKNSLLGKAAQAAGIAGLAPYLQGPTAAAFTATDPVAAAKVIQEFIRQTRKLAVKASVVSGRVYGEAETRALADLPGRQELLARVVGGVAAPLAALVGVLGGLPRALVSTLDQVRRQQEGHGAAAG